MRRSTSAAPETLDESKVANAGTSSRYTRSARKPVTRNLPELYQAPQFTLPNDSRRFVVASGIRQVIVHAIRG